METFLLEMLSLISRSWSCLLDFLYNDKVLSALTGILGVLVGAHVTSNAAVKREISAERRRDEREARYLAVIVTAHLDRFVMGCASVAGDDGTSNGQPSGENGIHEPTVVPPRFDALSLNVEWKSLDGELMYEILRLPGKADFLSAYISELFDDYDPPYYTFAFVTRQHRYAELGLEVMELSRRLKTKADLPVSNIRREEWSIEDYLRDRRQDAERYFEKRARSD